MIYMSTDSFLPPDDFAPSQRDDPREFKALQSIISALQGFDVATRRRILSAAGTFLQVSSSIAPQLNTFSMSRSDEAASSAFSTELAISPKDFMLDKQPQTDVERIASLAYYLTHFRDQQHFKTLDLSKLNTEAAQPKFSNAANAANNAVKRGYLVPSTKGQRQLSAAGERFVEALPDRTAAREAMASAQPRRRSRRSTTKRTSRIRP